MSALNTAMNVIGTVASLKSLLGNENNSAATGKLNNFMSEIRQSSVARTNLFEVTLTAPRILTGSGAARKISLYAEGASLPGLSLETGQVTRYGFGPNEKIPYSLQTNDTTISFIGDGKGEIYKFFYNWLQGIVRADYNVPSNQTSSNGLSAYEVEFKEDYKSTITITTFNEVGTPVFVYDLSDAFPLNVPDVSLNWSDSSMMQFSVQFAFLQSKLQNAGEPLALTASGVGNLSPFQKLVKIGTAVQTIAALRRPTSVQDALNSAGTIKTMMRAL
jgi:hypothetical protein